MLKSIIKRQPVYYIPHGAGPCFFMDWTPATTWTGMENFLKNIANDLPQMPKAIIMVSAHWLQAEFRVTAHAQPELIYDYFGFPEHTYQLNYPALGQPKLAASIVQCIEAGGMKAYLDSQRGFDHGVFIPLKLMFPAANIPVIQLSLQQDLNPELHQRMGYSLNALRDENVLIIASGMSFHNMRAYGNKEFSTISDQFDAWLTEVLQGPTDQRFKQLNHWEQAPHAHLCHPEGHEEHLLPLMVAAGAAGTDQACKVYSERVLQTRISAFRFG